MTCETRDQKNLSQISSRLLRWYGKNARVLPWRIGPAGRKAGAAPDPYRVWLSEIMLQQTTVATVKERYAEFLIRWPDVRALAKAPLDDVLGQWAGLGYYARARNLHKCAVVVAKAYGGNFPDAEEELKTLPGIGDYTAAAIAAIAFDRKAIVVDGNIERVVSRLFAIETPLPAAKKEIKFCAEKFWPKKRSGDFAQSLMDLGAATCKPKNPNCSLCPISFSCRAFSLGRPEGFPVRAAKKPKPSRSGVVFALTNKSGELLLERRPEKGLLGGMMGLPGSPWAEGAGVEPKKFAPAIKAKWRKVGAVTHTFTHFHLELDVCVGRAPKGFRRNPDQQWVAPEASRLPTVMKKAVELALTKKGNEP
ncbi:MAG: A/G-specific adenine glycosylase [Hyphococcus sp.]|nr:MAG: A/G-specific adenine glycosylase [Marinicaulis sp.]